MRSESTCCMMSEEEDGGREVLRTEAVFACACGPTHSP